MKTVFLANDAIAQKKLGFLCFSCLSNCFTQHLYQIGSVEIYRNENLIITDPFLTNWESIF